MDSGERFKQENVGDSLPQHSDIPKPIWVRHFGLQTDTINAQLLAYNVRIICIGTPILWLVLHFLFKW